MPDHDWLDKERMRRQRFAHAPSSNDALQWVKSYTTDVQSRHRAPSSTATGRFRVVRSVANRARASKILHGSLSGSSIPKNLRVWYLKDEYADNASDQTLVLQLVTDVPGLGTILLASINKARELGIEGEAKFGVTRDRPACIVLSFPAKYEQRSAFLRALDNWLVNQPIQAHRRLIVDVHEP